MPNPESRRSGPFFTSKFFVSVVTFVVVPKNLTTRKTYREWQKKTNILDRDEDDTVEFQVQNTWFFDESKSEGLTGEEELVVPHTFILAMAMATMREKPAMAPIVGRQKFETSQTESALENLTTFPVKKFKKVDNFINFLFSSFEKLTNLSICTFFCILNYFDGKRRHFFFWFLGKAIDSIFRKPPSVFVKVKAKEILFTGLPIDCTVTDLSGSAVCQMLRTNSAGLVVESPDHYRFSYFGAVSSHFRYPKIAMA